MEKEIQYPWKTYLRDLAHYIKPYKKTFWIGVLFRLTSDITQLYPAYALSQIVVILSQNPVPQDLTQISILIGIWIGLNMYYSFAHDYSRYLGYLIAEIASIDLYRECLAHIFKLDLTWQEKENSGNKMKRIDRGRDGINETVRRFFDVLIEFLVNIVGITIIFFTIDTTITSALVLFIVTLYVLGIVLLKPAVKQERIVNKQYEDLSGFTFESLNNVATIKSLAISVSIMDTLKAQSIPLVSAIRRRILLFRTQNGILLAYYYLFEFVMICFIVWGIVNGQYQISLLVLFIGLLDRVGTSIWELIDVSQQIVVSKIWVSRAMQILKTEPTIEHPETVAKQQLYPENWKELRIENVHFKYKKSAALKDVSLTIKRGESIGIVGLSGAGKSTLFKLLLDLHEDYDGDILLDDIPLKNIQRQSYIDHLAVVLQDTELFNMSLKDNINLSKPGTKQSLDVAEVIAMAHLDDVIKNLPQGIDTMVGEKGIKLSGGQRQRVGIARALFRQPDILLLDEATSHLDAYSEKQIQEALHETMHNFTTIVIAHRLSTIKELDRIVVLEKGKVLEVGTFTELIAKKGAFAKMWQAQKL